jgi:hypothetical protein
LILGLLFGSVSLTTPTSAAPEGGRASARDLAAAGLGALGAPDWVVGALADDDETEADYPHLKPVGDLDGDGARDLIVLTREGELPVDQQLVVTARRGTDGSQLFRAQTGLAGSDALVQMRSVGVDGAPGILLATYTYGFANGPRLLGAHGESPYTWEQTGLDVALHVLALGGDGSPAWSRSFTGGQFLYTGTNLAAARDVPILIGASDVLPGAATDVTVAVYNRTPTADDTGQDDDVQVVALDGTDGEEVDTFSLDIDNTSAVMRAAPDLDGDGLDDLLVRLRPVAEESPVIADTLVAVRGADGEELWRSTVGDLGSSTAVLSVGDATGDDISEISVGRGNLRAQGDPGRNVVLLDGASGAVLISAGADTSRALGDIDGDGLADFLLSTAFHWAKGVDVVHQAVDGAGKLLWEGSFTLEGFQSPAASLLAAPGDVDGDGVQDVAQRLRVRADESCCEEDVDARVLSGRTGETIRAGEPLGAPLGASLDAAGDDVSVITPFGASVLDVAAADGLTGQPFFEVRLRPRGDVTNQSRVDAADVTGDGTTDLIVNTTGTVAPEDQLEVESILVSPPSSVVTDGYVLDGRSGAIVWSTAEPRLPTPPELRGTASVGTPFSWTGATATGTNGQGPNLYSVECSEDDPTTRCEQLLVEFANPPTEGQETATATATISLSEFDPFPDPVTDLDLYVYESDELGTVGPEAGVSWRFGPPLDPSGEEVELEVTTTVDQPSRYYIVSVRYYRSIESGYQGEAKLA